MEKLDFIQKLDFIKTCCSKYTIEQMRRQATDWEGTFTKHILGKGLDLRTYKELL